MKAMDLEKTGEVVVGLYQELQAIRELVERTKVISGRARRGVVDPVAAALILERQSCGNAIRHLTTAGKLSREGIALAKSGAEVICLIGGRFDRVDLDDTGIAVATEQRSLRSRQDFDAFDVIVAMDGSNFDSLTGRAPAGCRAKVVLLRDFDPNALGEDVPDPYYGGDDGFEEVLDIVLAAGKGLLDSLRKDRGL